MSTGNLNKKKRGGGPAKEPRSSNASEGREKKIF